MNLTYFAIYIKIFILTKEKVFFGNLGNKEQRKKKNGRYGRFNFRYHTFI